MVSERNSYGLVKGTQIKDKLTSTLNEKFLFKYGIFAPFFGFDDEMLMELSTISAILSVESDLGIDRLDFLQRISLHTNTETMVDGCLLGMSRAG